MSVISTTDLRAQAARMRVRTAIKKSFHASEWAWRTRATAREADEDVHEAHAGLRLARADDETHRARISGSEKSNSDFWKTAVLENEVSRAERVLEEAVARSAEATAAADRAEVEAVAAESEFKTIRDEARRLEEL